MHIFVFTNKCVAFLLLLLCGSRSRYVKKGSRSGMQNCKKKRALHNKWLVNDKKEMKIMSGEVTLNG